MGSPDLTRRFASIGLVQPKKAHNVGAVLRAAGVYGAKLVALTGVRSQWVRSSADTNSTWTSIPVIRGEGNVLDMIPFGAVPVAVDLVEGATSLPEFEHPDRAFYIFGPEDGTLGKAVLNRCKHTIYVPTDGCMNLAASVNVVLYDRLAKSLQYQDQDQDQYQDQYQYQDQSQGAG